MVAAGMGSFASLRMTGLTLMLALECRVLRVRNAR
jgi:hypothetical protein